MMNERKWYYRLTNEETGDELYMSATAPIKKELLPGFFKGYTTAEISKKEYEENADDDK